MEIRSIMTFLKITELKNFTRAAGELGYAQSTVTMQIKQLEKELGFPLFDRIGKQVSLTEKGEQFRSYAYEIASVVDKTKELAAENITPSGKLRIGVIQSICSYKLEDLIGRYNQTYPDVSLIITTACTEELLQMLNRNLLDFVYTMNQGISGAEYVSSFLKPEKIYFVTKPGFLPQKTFTIPELLDYPLILTEQTCSYRQAFDDLLASRNLFSSPILETGNIHLITDMVKKNGGITLLPEFAIAEETKEHALEIIDVQGSPYTFWRQLIYRKDKWMNLQMKKFIELMKELD